MIDIENIYGFIYETTNIINNMKYIGSHKLSHKSNLDQLDNWYLGSGKLLKLAINKYGKDSFERKILCYCYNKNDLINQENYYLTKFDYANNKNYYNIIPTFFGGSGKGKNSNVYGKRWTLDETAKNNHRLAMIDNPNCPDRSGINNPAYNKHWYNNGIKTIYCYENEVPYGYVPGNLCKTNSGMKFYTNGIKNIMIDLSEVVPEGFYPGKTTHKKKIKKEPIIVEPKKRGGWKVCKYQSDNAKNKISAALKGKPKSKIAVENQRKSALSKHKHWYTDGITSKLFNENDIIPEGFSLGRTIKLGDN